MKTMMRMIMAVLIALLICQTALAKTVEIDRIGTIEVDESIQMTRTKTIAEKTTYEFLGQPEGIWRCMVLDVEAVKEDPREENAIAIITQLQGQLLQKSGQEKKPLNLQKPKAFFGMDKSVAAFDIYFIGGGNAINNRFFLLKGIRQSQGIYMTCSDADVAYWEPLVLKIAAMSRVR